jgi:putative transcriptional regulator
VPSNPLSNPLGLPLLALGLILLPAGLGAALPKLEPTPEEPSSFTGRLLVASPAMGDPRFRRTVILVVRHDRNGALGITINRPVGERSLATLLQAMGDSTAADAGSVHIFAGGPVQPEVGFVIHSADYDRQDTLSVNDDLAVTASLEVLRDMARNQGPRKSLVALGYAGWSPGQLESELARDDWLIAPASAALVFDTPRERVWDEAMAALGSRP